jgi:hypothetical protein
MLFSFNFVMLDPHCDFFSVHDGKWPTASCMWAGMHLPLVDDLAGYGGVVTGEGACSLGLGK